MSDERVPPAGRTGQQAPRAPESACGSPRLDAAVRALRAPVPVRPAWRDALLRELAAEPSPGASSRWTPRRAWSVTPMRAAAAALLCAALGAAGTYTAMRRAPLPARASGDGLTPFGAPPAVAASHARGVTTVRFAIAASGAGRVSVVGDFNRWDPSATPLRRVGADGTWEVTVPLPPGRHVYAFVVDGGLTTDPAAPRAADDDFGAPNSVVLVAGPST